MKIILVALFAVAIFADGALADASKVVKDPAEYSAYIAAMKIVDPAQRAAAMESFITNYPASVLMDDALSEEMGAYQQAGDAKGLENAATRLVERDASNVRATAVLTYCEEGKAAQGDTAALVSMKAHAQRGIADLAVWKQPSGMTRKDFAQMRRQMTAIFDGALGFAALQAKDYPAARAAYIKAFAAGPGDMRDDYYFAIAQLQMSPPDVNGFWYIGKAITLARSQKNDQLAQTADTYGRSRYKAYHGGEDGWDKLVASTAGSATEPKSFAKSVTPGASPAELAVRAVKENGVKGLSFSDYEYILGYRDASAVNKAAAAKVWAGIQGLQKHRVRLKMSVKVIKASVGSLDVAITDDNQSSNTTDMHVTLAHALATAPEVGSKINVVGTIDAYTLKPFLFAMTKAEVADSTEALAPQSDARMITNPSWIATPDGDTLERLYPPTALRMGLEGHAVAECTVQADGTLQACSIASEDPAGAGFGQAALQMMASYRMAASTADGKPTAGGRVRVAVHWKTAD